MLEICLGALLTQNTSWSNVVTVLSGLHRRGLLSLEGLRRVRRRRLETLLRSSGYYRQKARRVSGFLAAVTAQADGCFTRFLSGPLPSARKRLLAIDGIGPETADSMLLYGAGRPTFVVDAYTRRIAERWGVAEKGAGYDAVQKIFMESLPRSAPVYGEVHALMVELGKRHCRPVPRCLHCPVARMCATGRNVA